METAPLFSDIAYGPTGGTAHWLTCEDGVRIRAAHWPCDDAKGTVLLFPGRTEYIEKYGEAAGEFRAHGLASIAIDWRGQGLADRLLPERRLGHVGTFADYQKDVRAVMEHVRALGLPEPYYLVAHSMGGCIGLRSLQEGLPVKAVAFSAPMWGITLAPVLRAGAWTAASFARAFGKGDTLAPGQSLETFVLREPFDTNTLTRDKDMFERLQHQMRSQPDLALGGPTLHWLYESMTEMNRLAETPSPDLPCLTFLGTSENIVDPERIKQRMARWPGGKLEVLKGGEHEVMHEIPATREKVFSMMNAHFAANP